MDKAQMEYVRNVIDNEGFDYGLVHYTDFNDEVEDKTFHALREAYILARSDLREYLGLDEFE